MKIIINYYNNLVGTCYKETYTFNGEEYSTATKLRKAIIESALPEKVNFKLRDLQFYIFNKYKPNEKSGLPDILFSENVINKEEDIRSKRYEVITDFYKSSSASIIIKEYGFYLESTKHKTRGPFTISIYYPGMHIEDIHEMQCKDASEVIRIININKFDISKPQFNQIISQGKIPKTLSNKYPNLEYVDYRTNE